MYQPVQNLEYTEIYRIIHRKVIREVKTRKKLLNVTNKIKQCGK